MKYISTLPNMKRKFSSIAAKIGNHHHQRQHQCSKHHLMKLLKINRQMLLPIKILLNPLNRKNPHSNVFFHRHSMTLFAFSHEWSVLFFFCVLSSCSFFFHWKLYAYNDLWIISNTNFWLSQYLRLSLVYLTHFFFIFERDSFSHNDSIVDDRKQYELFEVNLVCIRCMCACILL